MRLQTANVPDTYPRGHFETPRRNRKADFHLHGNIHQLYSLRPPFLLWFLCSSLPPDLFVVRRRCRVVVVNISDFPAPSFHCLPRPIHKHQNVSPVSLSLYSSSTPICPSRSIILPNTARALKSASRPRLCETNNQPNRSQGRKHPNSGEEHHTRTQERCRNSVLLFHVLDPPLNKYVRLS